MTRNDTIASLAINSWINGGRVVWPGANLRWCDLRGVNLRGARLPGADLRYAYLRYADLRGAILSGSDLTGVKITLGNRTLTLTEETAR